MKENPKSIKRNNRLNIVLVVLIILLASALFLPFGYSLDLGPGPDQVRALTWEYLDASWFSGFRFVELGRMFESMAYTLPRYAFIYLFVRLYGGQSNKKRTFWIGILGELFPALLSLIFIFGWVQGWTQPPPSVSDHYFPIYIPIPSLLLVSFAITKIFPSNRMKDNGAS